MTEEDIQNIVGPRYDYSEEVRLGRFNLKASERREIYNIDFKTVFNINTSNLQTKEQANYQRRIEESIAKQKKEEERRAMAENSNIDNIQSSQQKKKKNQAPVVVLTEE